MNLNNTNQINVTSVKDPSAITGQGDCPITNYGTVTMNPGAGNVATLAGVSHLTFYNAPGAVLRQASGEYDFTDYALYNSGQFTLGTDTFTQWRDNTALTLLFSEYQSEGTTGLNDQAALTGRSGIDVNGGAFTYFGTLAGGGSALVSVNTASGTGFSLGTNATLNVGTVEGTDGWSGTLNISGTVALNGTENFVWNDSLPGDTGKSKLAVAGNTLTLNGTVTTSVVGNNPPVLNGQTKWTIATCAGTISAAPTLPAMWPTGAVVNDPAGGQDYVLTIANSNGGGV